MQIHIGKKIKELRKSIGKTQDHMAEAIGVTAQAVSRWENGGAYPDMELIPSIANYFGITIDELFGYEGERQNRIDTLVQSIEEQNKLNDGKDICIDACISAAREGLIEFPGNEKLMLCLASVLYHAGYARYGEHHLTDDEGYDVLDVERHKKYAEWQEAIKLYEKLLMSLGEGEMRHRAVRELVQLYENLGEYEKAKRIADNSPDIYICRELMMLKCCDGKARAEMHEQTLAKLISVASNLAVSAVMINQNQYSPMQAAAKLQSAIQLFDILENKDPYFAQIAHLYLYLSEFQWKSGNQNEAFYTLENAKACAQKYDTLYNFGETKNVTAELPDVWPWWCVPDYSEVAQEIQNDPRWCTWARACKGKSE